MCRAVRPAGDVPRQRRTHPAGHAGLAGDRGTRRHPLPVGPGVDVHPPSPASHGPARPSARPCEDQPRQGPPPARRRRHHRPHLPRRRHPRPQRGRTVAHRTRGGPPRPQPVLHAPQQPRGHAARRLQQRRRHQPALDDDSDAQPGPGGHAYPADGAHVLPVHQAAPTYRAAGYDLVVVAGRNYGAGSSRDWAAKAQALLGVRAVIAESYERIHRSNLIGMGVLPLEFAEGDDASCHPFGHERELSFEGLDTLTVGTHRVTLHLRGAEGSHSTAELRLRIFSRQELAYLRHGGILPYVVRRALTRS
ncbi:MULTISPECIES: hypothetical protein [unclassified Streptomyces]|uniref:hypothetical protein n=1 Tax=unclassified Streptomyces TaxID=2593676 RepID=UPI002365EFE0|nr:MULTISPECIES: hypothetical protein [unclassified Streptomyces]MDF3143205.1 hypothetical protein [Streptomyces sp. T21Q-yed]WDF44541.1 hypothetical protein PBV52_06055 [Streptomyces sp. T12]